MKKRVALCAIAKNEGPYLREWIAFHLAIGFDRIFIFDNESTDGSPEIYSSINDDRFEVRNWPTQSGKAPQAPAYNKFLEQDGRLFDWVMFLDLDEFLNLKRHNSISDFLDDYESYSAIIINWRIFGSSGLINNNGEFVIDRFQQASSLNFSANNHVKTIFRPRSIKEAHIHIPFLKSHTSLINTSKVRFLREGPHETVVDVAQINHYFTKSYEEFREKRQRGRADVDVGEGEKYRTEHHFHAHDKNDEIDTSIHRFKDAMVREYAKLSLPSAPPERLGFLRSIRRRLGLSPIGTERRPAR
jgi:hypothetical protein